MKGILALARLSLAIAAALGPRLVLAESLYTMTTSDYEQTFSSGYSSFGGPLDSLRRLRLNALFRPGNPSFDSETSPLLVTIKARGLALGVTADPNSSTLTLKIPSKGIQQSFTGRSREESLTALIAWFKRQGLVGVVSKALIESSPVDPIAGNPNSAQARSVDTAFGRGFTRVIGAGPADASEGQATSNSGMKSVGLEYRQGFGNYGNSTLTLPLGYTWRFSDDPRHQVSLDIPVTYQRIDGANAYGVGLGGGYSQPVNDSWVLTAGLDYGIAGSKDMGAAGHLLTGTISSLVIVPLGPSSLLHIGNMIGHSQTLTLNAGDYSGDPGIREFVLKNGLMAYIGTAGWKPGTGIEVFVMDTRFFGSKLYDSGYTEVGGSFGFSEVHLEKGKRYDTVFRLGLSGEFARGNTAVRLNAGYLF